MDDQRFDGLARAIGQTTTRRQAFRGLVGLIAGSVGLLAHDTRAARRGYDGPLESNGEGMSVVLFGSPAVGAPGRCRMNAALTTHRGYAYASVAFSSVDGSFTETVTTFTDSDGNATAQTRKSVPQGTVARCGVSVAGWRFGSDDTVITC